nr:MAG TPA: hypothetical protein [Caudoviricetes sp.]
MVKIFYIFVRFFLYFWLKISIKMVKIFYKMVIKFRSGTINRMGIIFI